MLASKRNCSSLPDRRFSWQVRLWRLSTSQCVYALSDPSGNHREKVTCLALRNGLLASGGRDGLIKVSVHLVPRVGLSEVPQCALATCARALHLLGHRLSEAESEPAPTVCCVCMWVDSLLTTHSLTTHSLTSPPSAAATRCISGVGLLPRSGSASRVRHVHAR